jgi:hypothetical protein
VNCFAMLLISAIVIVEVAVKVCFPSINSDYDHESRRRCRSSGYAQEVLRTEPALVVQELDCANPGEYQCQLGHTIAEYPPRDTHSHVRANDTDLTGQGMGLPIRRVRPTTTASSSPGTVCERRRLYSRLGPKTHRHHDIPTERPRRVRIPQIFSRRMES